MTPESLTLLIGALGGFLVIIGGGAKWMLSHLEAKDNASALRETKARAELSDRLREEIAGLRKDLASVQAEKMLYLRRILQLESFIHKHPNMEIPQMTGWPPL